MVKTNIFVVCDRCEKPLKDTDEVYGLIKYKTPILSVSDKNYTDYYLDQDCYKTLIKELNSRLRSAISDRVIIGDINNEYKFYVKEIDSYYSFYRMIFGEEQKGKWYIGFNHKDINLLMKIEKINDTYNFINFDTAIDLILSDFQHGRLMDLRRKFKEEAEIKKNEYVTVISCATSTSSTTGSCINCFDSTSSNEDLERRNRLENAMNKRIKEYQHSLDMSKIYNNQVIGE